MDELSSRASSFLRENILAVICFGIGLMFLVSGLIVFSGFGEKRSDVVFEASTTDQDGQGAKKDAATNKIVVDVAGAVNKPGVYRLDNKSRIEDALIAAGGTSSQADQGYIARTVNLASVLSDGAKVYVPFVNDNSQSLGVLGSSTNEQPGSSLININTASSGDLEALPGIGVVTAGKIISGRPYSSVEELVKNKTVSQKVFEQIKAKVSVY